MENILQLERVMLRYYSCSISLVFCLILQAVTASADEGHHASAALHTGCSSSLQSGYEMEKAHSLISKAEGFVGVLWERAAHLVAGDRTTPPKLKKIHDPTQTRSLNTELNLGLINDYIGAKLAAFEDNREMLQKLIEDGVSNEEVAQKQLNGWDESIAIALDQRAVQTQRDSYAYFGKNQTGDVSSLEHRHRIFKRPERGGMTEEWKQSMDWLKDQADQIDSFHLRFGRIMVQGFEASEAYVVMTNLAKSHRMNARFFAEKGEKGYRYSEVGFPVNIPVWRYDSAVKKAKFEGYRVLYIRSYAEFETRRIEFYKEYSKAFGVEKHPGMLLKGMGPSRETLDRMGGYLKRGLFSPLYTWFDRELGRGFLKKVLFPLPWFYDLFLRFPVLAGVDLTSGVMSQVRQFGSDSVKWFLSTRHDGGFIVEEANRQAVNWFRMKLFLNTFKQRVELLGFKLNASEEKIKTRIEKVLSRPINAPNAGSIGFVQKILLKEEKAAALSNAVFGGRSVPTENLSRLNNDGYQVDAKGTRGEGYASFWKRVKAKWQTPILVALTLSGALAWNIDRISYFILESPKIQYHASIAREKADRILVETLNLPSTPELWNQLKHSLKPFNLKNSDLEFLVHNQFSSYANKIRMEKDYNPLILPEFHAEVKRVLQEEVLETRQELARALIFSHLQRTLEDEVVPLTISEEMEKALIGKHLDRADVIEEIFAEFRRPVFSSELGQAKGYNLDIAKRAVKASQIDGKLSDQLYSDLIWYFHYGYGASLDYYYTQGANSFLTTMGGAYESFGRAPGLLKELPEGSVLYNYKNEDAEFEVLMTQEVRSVFVVATDEQTGFSQVEFVDADLPAINEDFLFVKTDQLD